MTGPASRAAHYRLRTEGQAVAVPVPTLEVKDYGMRLFIGLDGSLAKTAVCAITEHGKIVKEAQIASDPETVAGYVLALGGTVATIGLEAGPLSQWLHRGLTDAGLDFDGDPPSEGRAQGNADQNRSS